MSTLPKSVQAGIEEAVEAFAAKRSAFEKDAINLQNTLLANSRLKGLVHSTKSRTKDPTHLRDKLNRWAVKAQAAGKPLNINAANVFEAIGDLAGVRILHLHMRQIPEIHPLLMTTLDEEGYLIARKPEAKTCDVEYRRMFEALNIGIDPDESMYTSIHYVVRQNLANPRLCELQVRTLAEEVWGETSHSINYPHKTDSVACQEQLLALARVVSATSRLVDSIMASYKDHISRNK